MSLTGGETQQAHVHHEKRELKALHGLRFFAAFCILLSHSTTWLTNFRNGDATIAAINKVGQFFGIFGMPLFFVLSGFVIHYNYSHLFSRRKFNLALREFLVARVARLVPLFLVFTAIGILVDGMIDWATHHKVNIVVLMLHRLTLTQSWVYITLFGDRLVLDGGYGLSWSISTEMFFYIVYPAFAASLFMVRSSSRLAMTGAIWVVGVFTVLTLCWLNRNGLQWFFHQKMGDIFTEWDHSADRWFFYYSPYIRIFEFVLGCLAAQLFMVAQAIPVSERESKLGKIIVAVCCGSLLFLTMANLLRPFGSFSNYLEFVELNFGCALPLAGIIFCVARYEGVVTKFFSGAIIVALGEISYSIYTVHTYTVRIFSRPQADITRLSGIEAVLRITAAIALTILLSTATYRFIERPARGALRNYFQGPIEAVIGDNRREQRQYAAFLILVLAAFALYQFYIVPLYAPYTR